MYKSLSDNLFSDINLIEIEVTRTARQQYAERQMIVMYFFFGS